MSFDTAAIPTLLSGELLFFAGVRTEQAVRRKWARTGLVALGIAASVPYLLVILYYTHLFRDSAWFYAFRTWEYSDLSFALTGWIVGYCYSLIDPQVSWEKALWPFGFFVLLAIPFIKPILDPIDLDKLHNSCPNKVCLQTTYSTCGPASAATLLLALGQQASEKNRRP